MAFEQLKVDLKSNPEVGVIQTYRYCHKNSFSSCYA